MTSTSLPQSFIDLGLVIFPLAPMSKQPPIGSSGHLSWELEDSLDALDEIESGAVNVAIQTGARSRVVCVDIDPRNGGTREAAEQTAGERFNTRTHSTARGGLHFLFQYPTDLDHFPGNTTGKIAPGVDFKADGGYIVAPPSVTADGSYDVVSDAPIAPLPARLRALLEPRKRADTPETHYQYPETAHDRILQWHRENVRIANDTQEGSRDDISYKMLVRSMQLSFTVPDSVLSCDDVVKDFSDGVSYRIKGLGGKSERARAFAESNPRPHPQFYTEGDGESQEEDWTLIDDYAGDADRLADDKLNDIANAARVAELLGERARYVPGEGWYVWNGKVWMAESKDSEGITEIVSNANRKLFLDLAEYRRINAGAPKDIQQFVVRMNNMTGVRATVEKLQATRSLRTDINDLDAKPHLLTVRNGTIDLRNGDLLPHDHRNFLTRLIDLDYDLSARCPRWERFLCEVMPDNPELVGFLQRLTGYGITGEISEHAMIVHYGRGRNGKSVFLDTLQHVFGNISSVADWRSFAQQQSGGGSARSDIARLRGARLVTVNEGDAHTRMDEAQIKRMVSGDMLTARHLYQSEIQFRPQFLLQMATNAKPNFKGADEGLWNRVKLIPWSRYFEPHERDHSLTHDLQREAQGILLWGVRGAIEWYASGIETPEVVRAATAEYRDSSDELAGFLGESVEDGAWIVKQGGRSVPAAWLNQIYRTWAEAQNYQPSDTLNARRLKSALEERGISSRRRRSGVHYDGIAANMDIEAVAASLSGQRERSEMVYRPAERDSGVGIVELRPAR